MRYFTLLIWLVSLNILVTAQEKILSKGQLTKAEQEVIKLEREWLDAFEQGNVEAMNRIVADNFIIVYDNVSIRKKPEMLKNLNTSNSNSLKYTTENVESRVFGDTVILVGDVISEWVQDGKQMGNRSRYTDIYKKIKGHWQVISSHLSKIGVSQ